MQCTICWYDNFSVFYWSMKSKAMEMNGNLPNTFVNSIFYILEKNVYILFFSKATILTLLNTQYSSLISLNCCHLLCMKMPV